MGQSAFTVGTGKQLLKHRLCNTNIIENMFLQFKTLKDTEPRIKTWNILKLKRKRGYDAYTWFLGTRQAAWQRNMNLLHRKSKIICYN